MKESGSWRTLIGMLGYGLQLIGLLLMPVAVGLGVAIRSNQGLWWMLWFALAGVSIFYSGRMLMRLGPPVEKADGSGED